MIAITVNHRLSPTLAANNADAVLFCDAVYRGVVWATPDYGVDCFGNEIRLMEVRVATNAANFERPLGRKYEH